MPVHSEHSAFIRCALLKVMLAASALVMGARCADADSDCAFTVSSVFLDPVGRDVAGTFGHAVAVEGDWIAVGAPGVGDTQAGRVELFQRVGGTWTHHAILTPSASALGDRFGAALSMHEGALLVGAWRAAGAAPASGTAYLFRNVDGGWVEEAVLAAADGVTNDRFGMAVALEGDRAVIGAESSNDAGNDSGAVYVFERSDAGWSQVVKIVAPDAAALDRLGQTVGLDGDVVAVGVPGKDGPGSLSKGSVELYEPVEGGWTRTEIFSPLTTPFPDATSFGSSLALHGGVLLTNSVKRFRLAYERTTLGWSAPQVLVAPDGLAGSPTLRQVAAIAPTGDVAAWVAFSITQDDGIDVIWRDGGLWTTEQVVLPPGPIETADSAVRSVAIDGATVVGGVSGTIIDGVPSGRVFVADVPPRDRDHDGLDDACELANELAEDCDRDGVIDDAQRPFRYTPDSAPSEFGWYFGGGAATVLFVNRFIATGREQAVRSISWQRPIGPAYAGPATVVVYSDPDGDGVPEGPGTLLSAQPIVLAAGEPGEWVTIPLEPVAIGSAGASFFVGIAMDVNGDTFASSEEEIPYRQTSWVQFAPDGLDIENPLLMPWECLGTWTSGCDFSSVVLLRATLDDCDESGRLDSCELLDGRLVDLDGNGVPDTCEPSAFDLNGDGIVDGADLGQLLSAWGTCPAPCPADFDGDGAVNSIDLGILLANWG